MTTNEIEKQLRAKSEEQIKQCAADVVDEIRSFGHRHTNKDRRCISWYSKRIKPTKKFTSDPEPEDPYVTFDWDELQQLVERNMTASYLNQMVEKKAKELLTKIDLLG